MPVVETDIWDPFETIYVEDPYPAYATLRAEFPVFHNAKHDVYAISRFDDVQAAARDWRTYSSGGPSGAVLERNVLEPGHSFLHMDPQAHTELRGVVKHHFVPKNIEMTFGRFVDGCVDDLLASFADRSDVDLATDFARRLSMLTMMRLLDLPTNHEERLTRLATGVHVRTRGSSHVPQDAIDAYDELAEYLRYRVTKGVHGPSPDSLMATIHELGRRDEDAAVDVCILLVGAATETTTALLANSLLSLALHEHEREREILRSGAVDPRVAVEELLRHDGVVHYQGRMTARDVELHGTVIPEGSYVALLWAAANRDEHRFSNADELDFGRESKRNLGFGEGIHHCIGAPLARLEARIAIPAFLRAFPAYRLAGAVHRTHSSPIRGVERFPVALA